MTVIELLAIDQYAYRNSVLIISVKNFYRLSYHHIMKCDLSECRFI